MNKLSRDLLQKDYSFPAELEVYKNESKVERVLQFGEGNFLRGFVDWMFNEINKKGLFNGKVVIVQPIEQGGVDELNRQDGLYTLLLRGILKGEVIEKKEIITSVSRGINPYKDFNDFLKCAENPDLRFIISNTTEAGIAYSSKDRPEDAPPASYPGKLAVFLYKRYKYFNGDLIKGLVILPCELIDRNGDNLKKVILQLSEEWKYESSFIDWLKKANYFLNTLVDRIITGYPREESEKLTAQLGYLDQLLDTGEIFHLWVIEGDESLSKELPFKEAGLNVVWTDDLELYRTRKVRILNGAHTMTVLAAFLYGKNTVKECMDDEIISAYMKKGIFEEIIPTMLLPENQLLDYANAVLERFSNPFIKHYLLSISLNSISKFKTRVLPSLLDYKEKFNSLPKVLVFSLAALLAFYKGKEISGSSLLGSRKAEKYEIKDELPILDFFKTVWSDNYKAGESIEPLVERVLSSKDMWGTDLSRISGLAALVSYYLTAILSEGMEKALKDIL